MPQRAALRFVTYLGVACLSMAMWCVLCFVLWHFELNPRNRDMLGFALGFTGLGLFLATVGERLWSRAVRLEGEEEGEDAEVEIVGDEVTMSARPGVGAGAAHHK